MKRSFVNKKIEEAMAFCAEQNFHLPKWSQWSPEQWREAGEETEEIRRCMLGWDVTDFGKGDFENFGLVLFTVRNGDPQRVRDPAEKDYCEKILICDENQVTPMHFHWSKMEDIINRSGGLLTLRVWNADPDTEEVDEANPVELSVDGIARTFESGGKLILEPGESVALPQYVYHLFYAEPGHGKVLAGEVSRVNDDTRDNRFMPTLPRFSEIEEDEPARWLLGNEYPAL